MCYCVTLTQAVLVYTQLLVPGVQLAGPVHLYTQLQVPGATSTQYLQYLVS